MNSKTVSALVAMVVIIAAAIYIVKGAKDLGIGHNPGGNGQSVNEFAPGETTCIRYDLKDGAWVCSAIGTP